MANGAPFFVKDCTLSAIATGESAGSLVELRDKLLTIDTACIYYHFWGWRLKPQFTHPTFHNEFARWAKASLHDDILAERLGVIDPKEYENIELLRQDLIEVIEDRLDEMEIVLWSKKRDHFYFVKSKIIIFSTPIEIRNPKELSKLLPHFTSSTIFYHFIDARRRTPDLTDDISTWLKDFGDSTSSIVHKVQSIDPYFLSPAEIREKLIQIFQMEVTS